MKEFEKPEIQIIEIEDGDIIVASTCECVYSQSYGWNGCESGRAPQLN